MKLGLIQKFYHGIVVVALGSVLACSGSKFTADQASSTKPKPEAPLPQNADGERKPDEKPKESQPGKAVEPPQKTEDGGKVSADVVSLCAAGNKKVHTMTLEFPKRELCTWGKKEKASEAAPGANLSPLNEHLQARESQERTFSLPTAKAVFCGISLSSHEEALKYDDFLVITLGKYVLLVSNKELVKDLDSEASLVVWDFDKIRGRKYNHSRTERYCLGDQDCQVPATQQEGNFRLNIDSESNLALATKLNGQRDFSVSVIATGDNDKDQDCSHSDLSLELNISYAEAP